MSTTETHVSTESTTKKPVTAPKATKKPVTKKVAAAPKKQAKPSKAAKPAAKATAKKAKSSGDGKPSDAWSAKVIGPIDGKKIKLLVKENPKRGKSAKRFGIYKNGMKVEEFIEKGGYRADIRYDVAHKFISIQ